ncbi:hypothetical protein KC361_g27 [Hortaea werneckii]|nr:hypothetical protein KC361_g27 [Hortaea werneckii]
MLETRCDVYHPLPPSDKRILSCKWMLASSRTTSVGSDVCSLPVFLNSSIRSCVTPPVTKRTRQPRFR